MFSKFFVVKNPKLERKILGLTFKNPVGLAAGFDKNATMFNDLAYCGFGFIEIGTLTPKGQVGNDKPRLFRLKKDEAILNRMGFNNDGVEIAIEQLKNRKHKDLIIGGNIGKNKTTPNEEANADDGGQEPGDQRSGWEEHQEVWCTWHSWEEDQRAWERDGHGEGDSEEWECERPREDRDDKLEVQDHSVGSKYSVPLRWED